jgi:hypothetical protein
LNGIVTSDQYLALARFFCLAKTTKGTLSGIQITRRFKNPLFRRMFVLEIALVMVQLEQQGNTPLFEFTP